jgi:hypothetical protein
MHTWKCHGKNLHILLYIIQTFFKNLILSRIVEKIVTHEEMMNPQWKTVLSDNGDVRCLGGKCFVLSLI